MKKQRKERPKNLTTREELAKYLSDNPETEFPFNEKVWDEAVRSTQDKERKFKTTTQEDFEGNTKTRVIPNGAVNPVSKYFQMMALPHNRKSGEIMKAGQEKEDIVEDEEEFENDNKEFDGLIGMFFNSYPEAEKESIKERLAEYYDNYEINEGADKFLVIKTVADEIEMVKLTKMRLQKGVDVEARLEKVNKGYLSNLEGLKALKKQRGAMDDEGKNKFTLWVDTLEKEGFKYDFEDVSDKVDEMLNLYEIGIMKTFREG